MIQNHDLIVWSIVVGLVTMVAWGVYKALKEEAVFFYNYWDIFANLSILIVFLCGYFNHQEKWAFYALISSPIVTVIYNCFMGIRFNGWFLGLCVGTGRIILGYGIPLLIIATYITGAGKRDGETEHAYQIRRGYEKIEKLAMVGGLMFFLHRLVGHPGRTVNQKLLYSIKTEEFDGALDQPEEDSTPRRIMKSSEDNNEDVPFLDPVRLALRVPEVLPCEFDRTVQFWLKRIQFWGELKVVYADPYGQRKKVSVRDFEIAMTQPDELIERYGKWSFKKKSIKSFEAFRKFIDDAGKKQEEIYFVDIELTKDLKDAFNGKF